MRRVILYKTGVGYFEHRGRVTDSQDVAIRFTSGQLDDVLKSLTVLDLGTGRITGISYNSAAPLDRRLSALRLPVGQHATLIDLLAALRGARVELAAGGAQGVMEDGTRRREGMAVGGGTAGGVVGGLPGAAPPRPPAAPSREVADTLRDMQPAAAAADLGDLFEYRLAAPVTIAKDESALVPILNAEVTAEKISLWTHASGSGRPLRAVWLTNTSGLTLDGGSFSVVEGEAFGGEGVMEPLQPGERRLLSYAADLGVLVAADAGRTANRIVRLRGRDGLLIEDVEERTTAAYRIRNEDGAPRTVVVEHPIRSGWILAEGPEPAERSPQAYRFRVPVEARREVTIEVPERRTAESRIAIGDIDESRLEFWVRSGLAASDLKRALGPVLRQHRAVAALDEQLARLDAERQTIFADQERLRENLKTLGRSPEERQLVQRYTGQLDRQEDRIEAVGRELARATDERDRARQELARLIGEVTSEVAGVKG